MVKAAGEKNLTRHFILSPHATFEAKTISRRWRSGSVNAKELRAACDRKCYGLVVVMWSSMTLSIVKISSPDCLF
jgi:hypothetical protein